MSLTIEIPTEVEARLKQQADAAGKDVREYAARLVEQAVAKPSLDEILAPLRKQFAESGTTDEQLIDQITAAQAGYRQEKK